MKKKREVESIEKLLNTIRSGENVSEPLESFSKQQGSLPKKGGNSGFFSRKVFSLGIVIGNNTIAMALTVKNRNGAITLVDYSCVPIPGKRLEDPERLAGLLNGFIQNRTEKKKIKIWTILDDSVYDIRSLTIPHVADKAIANAVYWTYKKQAALEEEKTVFDFQLLGDIVESGVKKKQVLAYSMPAGEIQRLKNLFSSAGFPVSGITAIPFALQTLFKSSAVAEDTSDNFCALYMGDDFSRIAVFSHEKLCFTRYIKTGFTSFKDAIVLEQKNYDMEKAEKFLYLYIQKKKKEGGGGGGGGGIQGLGDIKESAFAKRAERLIFPALERLTSRFERTLEFYYNTISRERINELYLAGKMADCEFFKNHISSQTGMPVKSLDTSAVVLENSGQRVLFDTQQKVNAFALCLGVSMSDHGVTPNFLFTTKEKEKQKKEKKINRWLSGAVVLLLIACSLFFLMQKRELVQKEQAIDRLESKLRLYSGGMNRKTISRAAAEMAVTRVHYENYFYHYAGMAVISELSRVTPENIFFLNLVLYPHGHKEKATGPGRKKKGEKQQNVLFLHGIVKDEKISSESIFAGYLQKLEKSVFFSGITIEEKNRTLVDEEEVLQFKLRIGLS